MDSTEQNKNSLQSIQKQNSVLKEIINNSWNAIGIIDERTQLKFLNQAFTPLLGYEKNELLQFSLFDIILPDFIEPLEDLLQKNKIDKYINKITLGCKRKDSQIVYIEIVIQPMQDKKLYVINAHDVTTEVDKKILMDKFILQIHTDINDKIIKISQALSRLLGYQEKDLYSKRFNELLHISNDKKILNSYLESIQNNDFWTGNLNLQKIDGKPIYVEFSNTPNKNKYGDIVGFSGAMIDISSEIMLKEKILAGEEKLSIMGETIRTVAHEWRQPLNSISLDAQSLCFDLDFDDNIDKNHFKLKLEDISQSTDNLSNIIKNFQSISEFKGDMKKRNIRDILVEALHLAELYEHDFVKETFVETKSFKTYPKELASAIASILINAKEFVIQVENPQILINSYQKETDIVCEIKNNGGHIPSDILDKIFTPYFSTKNVKNAVGLSLYTTKMIIELHLKGNILVQNLENDFVQFTIILPTGALSDNHSSET